MDWGINWPFRPRRELIIVGMSFSLPDSRGLTDEVLEALRLRAIRALEKGWNECEVADVFGVARETVCRWWSDFRSEGIDGLPGKRTGRPCGMGRTLDEEQSEHLKEILDAHLPEDAGIAAALWTRRAVRDLIDKEYGVRMPLRTVGLYLARWGYTCKKPQRRAKKQDPVEIENWLKNTYPAIEARAAEEGAEIHWGDETGVLADRHPARGYARKGEPAIMEVPEAHLRVNVIATVTREGTGRFMTFTKAMTGQRFVEFLQKLIAGSDRKIFLIVDGLPAHGSGVVKQWLAKHRDQIERFYLPRRAPELNAEEYLNQDLKANVHAAGLPADKPSLQGQVRSFLQRLVRLPGHIKSYFQHPRMQYAAAGIK